MHRFVKITALALVVTLAGCGKQRGGGEAAGSTAAGQPAPTVALQFPPFAAALTTLPSSAVVVAGRTGVVCYSNGGERLWEFKLADGDEIVAPATAAPNSATYLRSVKSVYAISAEGKLLWKSDVEPAEVAAAVALGDSTVVVTSGSNTLVNLDGEKGAPRWRFRLPDGDRITSAPRVADNSWIYVRGNTTLYAVDPAGLLGWDKAFGDR